MAKALIIARMQQSGASRGIPDVAQSGLSFVHCSDAQLPGNYQAFVIAGTGAELLAVAAHANFACGQQIVYDAETGEYDWESARTELAPGVVTRANAWLVAHGMEPLTARDNMVTLIQRFNPNFDVGLYDVWDNTR